MEAGQTNRACGRALLEGLRDLLSGRTMDLIFVERIRTVSSLCPTVSGPRREGADFGRRRQPDHVVPHSIGTVLLDWRRRAVADYGGALFRRRRHVPRRQTAALVEGRNSGISDEVQLWLAFRLASRQPAVCRSRTVDGISCAAQAGFDRVCLQLRSLPAQDGASEQVRIRGRKSV